MPLRAFSPLFLLLSLLPTLAAAWPGNPQRLQRWSVADGLPGDSLNQVVEDSTGQLWIAGGQGLARYDGRVFEVFDRRLLPLLGSDEVRSLLPESDGGLLIGMAAGRILRRMPDGAFELLWDGNIDPVDLHRAADGTLSAGATTLLSGPPRALRPLLQLAVTEIGFRLFDWQGEAHALLPDGALHRVTDLAAGQRTPRTTLPPIGASARAVAVAAGRLYVADGGGLTVYDAGFRPLSVHRQTLPMTAKALLPRPDGSVWIGGGGQQVALCRMPSATADCAPVPVPTRNVTSLHADRHGALWITTWGDGLLRLTTTPFVHLAAADGVSGRTRGLAVLADGRVAFHTGARLHLADRDGLASVDWPVAQGSDQLLALQPLPDGRLVRGRLYGIDVASLSDLPRWTPLAPALDPPAKGYGLGLDDAGRLWVGDTRMLRLGAGGFETVQDGLALTYAYTRDRDGRLWAAGIGGIWRQGEDDRFVDAGAPPPPGRFITMSALTDRRGQLWFGGYESGLYRWDGGQWLRLDEDRGLPSGTAYGLADDAQGRLWVSHPRGLYTLDLVEADRLIADPTATARVRAYTRADGLPVRGFNGGAGQAMVQSSDGRLWLSSDDGIVHLDPAELPQPLALPPVRLEAARADEAALLPAADGNYLLPPGTAAFHARLLLPLPGVAERVVLRYRLAPLESGWRTLPEDGGLHYERLPRGDWQLEVQARVDNEDWQTLLTRTITQLPSWWQRPGVWAALALVLIGGAGLGLRWRLRRLAAQNRRLAELVEARGRELAAQQLALDEQARELAWHRRHRLLEAWAQLDGLARTVAVALHDAPGSDRAALHARLGSTPDPALPQPTPAEIDTALARLQTAGLAIAGPDGLRLADEDWASVPDFDLPLTELLARSARRVGAFRLLERIGEGGMGEVYRAVNVHDGRLAALKLVHRDLSAAPEARRRLAREGELVSQLRHPRIVRLLERGEHDGRLYLAMDYLPGQTLAQRLETGPPLPLAEALSVLADLAEALTTLHQQGVIHRDLHPGNVMLGPDGHAVLLDFGLARGMEVSAVTRTQGLIGSLPYLAPELLAGDPARPGADLFALGCIAVELTTGTRLWRGQHTVALIAEIASYRAPPTLDGLPDGLADLIRQLLARDPEQRGEAASVWRTLRVVSVSLTPSPAAFARSDSATQAPLALSSVRSGG